MEVSGIGGYFFWVLKSKEWKEGYRSCALGLGQIHNPYIKGSTQYCEWSEGHLFRGI